MTAPVIDKHAAQQSRGTLVVEDAVLQYSRAYAGEQFTLRLYAPECARRATAGSFVHIQCDPYLSMRRPLSIMRASPEDGWIEVLFKIVGEGLRRLSQAKPGDSLSIIGPVGRGFTVHPDRPFCILVGGGVGIPPMIFLAEQILGEKPQQKPVVFMGSEIPFPFDVIRSQLPVLWLNNDVVSAMPLLEDWGVVSRLASLSGFDGCHSGYVTDLTKIYLESLSTDQHAKCEIFACGPTAMLKAVAVLAKSLNIACQVSLEEYMACAVGGCAGCAVMVRTQDGSAMKRVCVDGPVFSAADVFY